LPPLSDEERDLAGRIRKHVKALAGDIGPRTIMGRYAGLVAAERYVADTLAGLGFKPVRHTFTVAGKEVANIEAVLPGTEDGIVVVGAHFDTVSYTPGADDNASAVAVMLELARLAGIAGSHEKTIRFVGFPNEEPPFFQTPDMGSRRYAAMCRKNGDILDAVIILESVGYYDDAPGSQRYPAPLSLVYPDTGDFIAFVGNLGSTGLTRTLTRLFREHAAFPSQGGALPGWLTGVGWSDHWSFWREGYDAVMVTDTALFRNPHYHTPGDRPETLDYELTARVAAGLWQVLRAVANNAD
jgi:Zn-dependent M28 family amino/carboxypeptidase